MKQKEIIALWNLSGIKLILYIIPSITFPSLVLTKKGTFYNLWRGILLLSSSLYHQGMFHYTQTKWLWLKNNHISFTTLSSSRPPECPWPYVSVYMVNLFLSLSTTTIQLFEFKFVFPPFYVQKDASPYNQIKIVLLLLSSAAIKRSIKMKIQSWQKASMSFVLIWEITQLILCLWKSWPFCI